MPSVTILLESGTAWGRKVISGILEYAQQNGPWHITLQPRGPEEHIKLPADWHGDGIIGRIATPNIAKSVKAARVPVVNTSAVELPGVNFPRVQTTIGEQAKMAFELFQRKGFRNYAYVGNPSKDYIQKQFHDFDAHVRNTGSESHFFSSDQGQAALIQWLKKLPKPVGVFCWGAEIGCSVIDACFTAKIPVPHDVAVLGADYDELLSEVSYPPQSGILLATEHIGRTAAAVLDVMMKGQKPKQRDYFVPPLGFVEKLSTDTFAVKDPRMAAVMRFIQTHYREPISVEDVLRANPMARRSMERRFRNVFGYSIVDHIRRVRVNEARFLLATSELPISLIAERCGFSSYNYMDRVFQEVLVMSPRDYRAASQGKKLIT